MDDVTLCFAALLPQRGRDVEKQLDSAEWALECSVFAPACSWEPPAGPPCAAIVSCKLAFHPRQPQRFTLPRPLSPPMGAFRVSTATDS